MVRTIVMQQTKAFFYCMYVLFGAITAFGIYAFFNNGYGLMAGFGVGFMLALFLVSKMNNTEKEEPESWLKDH